MLGGAALAAFFAVRGAIDALLPPDQPAPVKRAILHSLMTAIVSLAAVLHRPSLLDIAAGVPFSATVAAMTLALGVIVFVALPEAPTKRRPSHLTWAFVLPTGLLALMIGFSGRLVSSSALVLAGEGATMLMIFAGQPKLSTPTESSQASVADRRFAAVQATLAGLLAIVAGWGMVQGAAGLALHNPAFRPGIAAVLALGPAIVMPMIPPLATLAERGRRDEAITALVGFALINLCIVLPGVVFAQQLIQKIVPATQPSASEGIPFPLLVWRLDTVLLSTVGLLLLPTAIGRWTLSRIEGLGLVGLYVIYLFLTLLMSRV